MLLILVLIFVYFFFFSSRRRHTRCLSDWSSDVCSSDLSASDGFSDPEAAPLTIAVCPFNSKFDHPFRLISAMSRSCSRRRIVSERLSERLQPCQSIHTYSSAI